MDTKQVVGQQMTWTDFDSAQTLANHEEGVKPKIIALINDFDNFWFKKKGNQGKNHQDAIKACQAEANRLFGGCDL